MAPKQVNTYKLKDSNSNSMSNFAANNPLKTRMDSIKEDETKEELVGTQLGLSLFQPFQTMMAGESSLTSNPTIHSSKSFSQGSSSKVIGYFHKENLQKLLPIEDYFQTDDINKIASYYFRDFNYHIEDCRRDHAFYEFILVDTNSIQIHPYPDKYDSTNISHTSVKIFKVMSIQDWNQSPSISKRFSIPLANSNLQEYTYWDYQAAWYKTFYFQNKKNQHSWFFIFSKNIKRSFPIWFIDWWKYFGPTERILTIPANEGYSVFLRKFIPSKNEIPFPKLLLFFSKFQLAWISAWDYVPFQMPNLPTILCRKFKVKWWVNFQVRHISPSAINDWFAKAPVNEWLEQSEEISSQQFLLRKNELQAQLSAASTTNDMKILLKQIQELTKEESDEVCPTPVLEED